MKHDKRLLTCRDCRTSITRDKGVLQSIEEFLLLFPETKLTTNTVIEWCGDGFSPRAVRRILSTYFQRVGKGKYSYYQ